MIFQFPFPLPPPLKSAHMKHMPLNNKTLTKNAKLDLVFLPRIFFFKEIVEKGNKHVYIAHRFFDVLNMINSLNSFEIHIIHQT